MSEWHAKNAPFHVVPKSGGLSEVLPYHYFCVANRNGNLFASTATKEAAQELADRWNEEATITVLTQL